MSTHTTRRLATTLAAAVAVLSLGAAPALAESQSHQDPRGDVEKVDSGGAKDKAGIDLVRAQNEFTGGTLSLSMTGAKLPGKGYIAAWILTSGNAIFQLVFDHTKKKTHTDFAQIGGRRAWSPRTALRGEGSCPGVKVKVKDDVVSGSIPRACLNGANEVRVATVILEPISTSQFKVDDARQKGYDPADGPKFGPTLERN